MSQFSKKVSFFVKELEFSHYFATPMETVLTIAGYDPSSGAGVSADLMVFAAHRLWGISCITALTVQSTMGVRSTHPVSDEIVAETLDCLDADLRPAGVKIGMVANEANILRICAFLEILNDKHSESGGSSHIPVVLDPVLRSSSGRELLNPPGLTALREQLLPLVDWVTPNLDELAAMLGRPKADREDIPAACRSLQAAVARWRDGESLGIVATGGHLDRPDDFVMMPNGEGVWLQGEHVATRCTHGTGCAFSSAFLCRLVLGDRPEEAARAAKNYVVGALRTADQIGRGTCPINHLWPLLRTIHQIK